jgi:hypothetical protein
MSNGGEFAQLALQMCVCDFLWHLSPPFFVVCFLYFKGGHQINSSFERN